jgi:hypothetical protein
LGTGAAGTAPTPSAPAPGALIGNQITKPGAPLNR